jgi:hypothetical protein
MKRFLLSVYVALLPFLFVAAVGCSDEPSAKAKIIKGGMDPEKAKPNTEAKVQVFK